MFTAVLNAFVVHVYVSLINVIVGLFAIYWEHNVIYGAL